jgi:hypothetical protein
MYIEVLSVIILDGWGKLEIISDEEFRDLLLEGNEEFRAFILHYLRWRPLNTPDIWSRKIIVFLEKIWPKQKKVKSNRISTTLWELALSQKDNFPEVSKLVANLVSKIKGGYIQEEEGENLASQYPKDYLGLLYAVLPDNAFEWPYRIMDVLKKIEETDPKLLKDVRLIELKSKLSDL